MCFSRGLGVVAVAVVIDAGDSLQLIGSQQIGNFEIQTRYSPWAFARGDDSWCSCLEREINAGRDRSVLTRLSVDCLNLTRMLVADAPTMPRLPSGLYLPERSYAALPEPA